MKARSRFPVWMWGIIALALAALACDPPPITGITCLYPRDDGAIIAPEEYNSVYISTDGGMTWQQVWSESGQDQMKECSRFQSTREPWTQADPADPNVVYRFNPEISIERSEDGGKTWRREVDLAGTEARTVYYVRFRDNTWDFRSGPLDALFDSNTGNLIVAMGYEGVLVRTPDVRWHWIAVGANSRADMRNLSITLPLISWELALALVVGSLTICSLPVLSWRRNLWLIPLCVLASLLTIALVVGSAIGVGIVANLTMGDTIPFVDEIAQAVFVIMIPLTVLAAPSLISWGVARRTHQEETLAFVWSGMGWTYLILYAIGVGIFWQLETIGEAPPPPVICGMLIALVISGFVLLWSRFSRQVFNISAGFGTASALIIALCYFLWGIGGIPFYTSATLWAIGLNVASLAIGIIVLRRLRGPDLSPSERDVAPVGENSPE